MSAMDVLLLRHGQTPGNRLHRYIGRTDQPLTDEGTALAQAGGTVPSVAVAHVSPLLRARQTARICLPNAWLELCPGLREMDFGDFENRSAEEMMDDPAYRAWVEGGCLSPCPNGESVLEFQARVCEAFSGLLRKAAQTGARELAIVAHGGTIMAIMDRYARDPRKYFEWYVPNCGGYRLQIDPEALWVSGFTFYDSLRALDLPAGWGSAKDSGNPAPMKRRDGP